jgi:hypothetical protein
MHECYFRLPELGVLVNDDCFLYNSADYQDHSHFKHRQNAVKGTHSYGRKILEPHIYARLIATGTLGIRN